MAQVLWTKQLEAFNTWDDDQSSAITMDSSGNSYIAYATYDTISGGTREASSILIALFKLDANGQLIWTAQNTSFDADGYSWRPAMKADDSGSIYLTYYTSATVSGGVQSGNYDVVVCKINATTGSTIWAIQRPEFNTDQDDSVPSIAIDGSGNVYVAYCTAGGKTSGQTLTGLADIVVFKLNSNGETLWVRQQPSFNTVQSDFSPSIGVDGSGNVYVANYLGSSTVIAVFKLDTNGNDVWRVQDGSFSTATDAYDPRLEVDTNGNCYVAYEAYSTASGQTLTGGGDIVVFKLNSSGQTQWVTQQPAFNTIDDDRGPAIGVDSNGNSFVAYYGAGVASGQTSTGDSDIVVFKVNSTGQTQWVIQQPSFNTNQYDGLPSLAVKNGKVSVTYTTVDGVASGGTNTGLSDIVVFQLGEQQPPCFNHDTKILCIDKNCRETYIAIQDIHPGMIVKTLNYGARRVEMCGHTTMINDPSSWKHCMYKMTKRGAMIDDLIVTGGHSILLDKPTTDPDEIALQKTYWNGKRFYIDNKPLILAAVSKLFTKITDRCEFTYYHLVLEAECEDRHYGVWANGVLAETQTRRDFLRHHYKIIEKIYL